MRALLLVLPLICLYRYYARFSIGSQAIQRQLSLRAAVRALLVAHQYTMVLPGAVGELPADGPYAGCMSAWGQEPQHRVKRPKTEPLGRQQAPLQSGPHSSRRSGAGGGERCKS